MIGTPIDERVVQVLNATERAAQRCVPGYVGVVHPRGATSSVSVDAAPVLALSDAVAGVRFARWLTIGARIAAVLLAFRDEDSATGGKRADQLERLVRELPNDDSVPDLRAEIVDALEGLEDSDYSYTFDFGRGIQLDSKAQRSHDLGCLIVWWARVIAPDTLDRPLAPALSSAFTMLNTTMPAESVHHAMLFLHDLDRFEADGPATQRLQACVRVAVLSYVSGQSGDLARLPLTVRTSRELLPEVVVERLVQETFSRSRTYSGSPAHRSLLAITDELSTNGLSALLSSMLEYGDLTGSSIQSVLDSNEVRRPILARSNRVISRVSESILYLAKNILTTFLADIHGQFDTEEYEELRGFGGLDEIRENWSDYAANGSLSAKLWEQVFLAERFIALPVFEHFKDIDRLLVTVLALRELAAQAGPCPQLPLRAFNGERASVGVERAALSLLADSGLPGRSLSSHLAYARAADLPLRVAQRESVL